MIDIDENLIFNNLQSHGFRRLPVSGFLFGIKGSSMPTPSFYCRLIRKRGKVRLSGAVGLYFQEFECIWNRGESKADKKTGFTLPLVMAIENFVDTMEGSIFEFSDHLSCIAEQGSHIYNLCFEFPKSIDEFNNALLGKKMVGKSISNYLHIFNHREDEDAFFRKSVSFIHWFSNNWPEHAEALYQCLTPHQRERLGLGVRMSDSPASAQVREN